MASDRGEIFLLIWDSGRTSLPSPRSSWILHYWQRRTERRIKGFKGWQDALMMRYTLQFAGGSFRSKPHHKPLDEMGHCQLVVARDEWRGFSAPNVFLPHVSVWGSCQETRRYNVTGGISGFSSGSLETGRFCGQFWWKGQWLGAGWWFMSWIFTDVSALWCIMGRGH